MSRLRVAMIAPPWLALPIKGYGGIELVVEGLVRGLKRAEVDVVLFANGARRMRGVSTHALYQTEQFTHIHRPMYESYPIMGAHLQSALVAIKSDGNFDIIHDHNGFLGPQLLAWASHDRDLPPMIHTHHGAPFSSQAVIDQGIPDNRPYWQQLAKHMGRLYLVGISDALMAPAPVELRPHILPTVYNALDCDEFPFVDKKDHYFITLARFARDKGQHVAARICAERGYRLRMAGTVAGIETPQKLLAELANPLSPYRSTADFRYYSDQVLQYVLKHPNITYSGNLSGARKHKFISHARALLFPIDWEEPFGMAVIEALACGTPVVAMKRGAMPEIIEHGVTGFLANDEDEFAAYVERVHEIDPAACRAAVQRRFCSDAMSEGYIERYKLAIDRARSFQG